MQGKALQYTNKTTVKNKKNEEYHIDLDNGGAGNERQCFDA